MDTIIFGNGNLGRAIAAALVARGDNAPRLLGRPSGSHPSAAFEGTTLAFEASRGDAVAANVAAALDAGCRRFVIATTAWDADRSAVAARLVEHGAAAVVAPNFSLGVALYLRLVEMAAASMARLAPVAPFDPFVVEWHRRGKLDRPSGTAREIVRRLGASGSSDEDGAVSRHDRGVTTGSASEIEVAVVRAGSSPGMHLVGFDAPGETIELRHTARDRSAFATGAVAAADWLRDERRQPGIHGFDEVVDDLLQGREKRVAVAAR